MLEWEYAARAGTTSAWSADDLAEVAWFRETTDERRVPMPVGQLQPNDLGLFDVHGNVQEWVEDVYREYGDDSGGPLVDPAVGRAAEDVTTAVFRVLRGGGVTSTAASCRSAARGVARPHRRTAVFGFRLARTWPR